MLYDPCNQEGVEKYLLRDSFRGLKLIPDEILWRKKIPFGDGMMLLEKTWYNYLQEHLESKVCLWSVVKFSLMFCVDG